MFPSQHLALRCTKQARPFPASKLAMFQFFGVLPLPWKNMYIYIYTHMYVHIYIFIYIYIPMHKSNVVQGMYDGSHEMEHFSTHGILDLHAFMWLLSSRASIMIIMESTSIQRN